MEIISKSYQEEIIEHYEKTFNNHASIYIFDKGPFEKLPIDFRLLEFPPIGEKTMWTYATCCMSQPGDTERIEIHMFSMVKDHTILELLSALAYYHRSANKVGLNHTVNFGRPWQDNSLCTHGYISLPYLDGSKLEKFESKDGLVNFYWLIPVTEKEVEYKKEFGADALEIKFETPGFNYVYPARSSTVR
jgi:hypothetical protein